MCSLPASNRAAPAAASQRADTAEPRRPVDAAIVALLFHGVFRRSDVGALCRDPRGVEREPRAQEESWPCGQISLRFHRVAPYDQAMAEVRSEVTLENTDDRARFRRGECRDEDIRRTTVEGIVDPSATNLIVIPQDLVQRRLGLRSHPVYETFGDELRLTIFAADPAAEASEAAAT